MAAEQKRPLVVFSIALLHCLCAARLFVFGWQVAPVVRAGTDIHTLCVNVRPLFQSADMLGCTTGYVEGMKLDLVVGGMASLVLGAFLFTTAIGLLRFQKWARSWAITIWAMMLAIGSHDYIHPRFGRPGFRPDCVYFVIGFTIVLALLYSSGVPESFGESD